MEQGVAPAVVSRKHVPGRLGSPSVPTTRGCLEWLGGARNEDGESRPGYERVDPFRSEPWKHGPEVERRHSGAPGGERASQSTRRLRKVPNVTSAFRRSAPSWDEGREMTAAPTPNQQRGR